MIVNSLQLPEVGDFEALNGLQALNWISKHNSDSFRNHLSTEPAFCRTPIMMAFFSLRCSFIDKDLPLNICI